jgi:hypothetical protein
MTDGQVKVEIIERPSVLSVNEENVTLLVNEEIVTLNLGITGPQGPKGSSILNGSGEPSLYLGELNDFYLNTDTYELYGPKSASGWGTPVELALKEDLGYVHTQSIPSAVWNVSHNLGFVPNVTVVNSFGEVVEGSYTYTSNTAVELTFDGSFSGKAYFS